MTLAAAFGAVTPAQAAGWPDSHHPLDIVVGFPAGGGVDALARAVQQGLAAELHTDVLVENKAGAGGIVGTEYVAKSKPDGYTVYLATPGTFTIWPNMRKLPFDPEKDFAPVSLMVTMPNLLVTSTKAPYTNVASLIAAGKTATSPIHYASGGIGTIGQIAAEQFNMLAGIHMVQVPYKGTAPLLTDVIAGVVPVTFSDPSAKSMIDSGQLRLLAVTGAERSKQFPNTPTVAESGVPGYAVMNWYGMVAPKDTPPDVIKTLNAAMVKVMAEPEVQKRLATYGMDAASSTPGDFGKLMNTERARWGDLIKKANIKPQ